MKFSVIIPSYLGNYRTAATNREDKLVRAVLSVLSQTCKDFEVIVIADGCQKTVEIMKLIKDDRVTTSIINKSKIWSGAPRNVGIEMAQGDYIIYLDIDDLYGDNHLQNIANGLSGFDWVWFDDIRYYPKTEQWYINHCDIRIAGKNGTSNICHKRSLPVRWDFEGYAHDYYFIKSLRNYTNFTKIEGGEYYVMHVPHSDKGKGWDL